MTMDVKNDINKRVNLSLDCNEIKSFRYEYM